MKKLFHSVLDITIILFFARWYDSLFINHPFWHGLGSFFVIISFAIALGAFTERLGKVINDYAKRKK